MPFVTNADLKNSIPKQIHDFYIRHSQAGNRHSQAGNSQAGNSKTGGAFEGYAIYLPKHSEGSAIYLPKRRCENGGGTTVDKKEEEVINKVIKAKPKKINGSGFYYVQT